MQSKGKIKRTANLQDGQMKSAVNVIPPRIPKQLIEKNLSAQALEDEDIVMGAIIQNETIEASDIRRLYIKESVFQNVDFKQVKWENVDIVDTRFENCDLSNCSLMDGVMHRVEFINCKMVGANMSGMMINDLLISGTHAEYVNFSFSKFKQVQIVATNMRSGDIQSCVFKGTLFQDLDLRAAQLAGTKLLGMNLTHTDIAGISIRPEDLYGASVTPMQAVELAHLFGLKVID